MKNRQKTLEKEETLDRHTLKFISSIAECLPQNLRKDISQEWIENPRALQEFLKMLKVFQPNVQESRFHRYPIQMRELKNSEELKTLIKLYSQSNNFKLSGEDVPDHLFDIKPEKKKIKGVFMVPVDALGFEAGGSIRDIIFRAERRHMMGIKNPLLTCLELRANPDFIYLLERICVPVIKEKTQGYYDVLGTIILKKEGDCMCAHFNSFPHMDRYNKTETLLLESI
jgi:hypothetical protein